jgi:hypothetical protein
MNEGAKCAKHEFVPVSKSFWDSFVLAESDHQVREISTELRTRPEGIRQPLKELFTAPRAVNEPSDSALDALKTAASASAFADFVLEIVRAA